MTTTTVDTDTTAEAIAGPDLNPPPAPVPAVATAPPKPVPADFDEFELAVRRMLGIEDASAGEMALFHHICQRSGLDPFSREIYMIGRNTQVTEWEDSPNGGERRKVTRWVTRYTIQVGINGFRRRAREIAAATGSQYSVSEPLWCGEDGQWRDVWIGKTPPAAAKVTVFRDGSPYTLVALYDEFVQTYRDKNSGSDVPNSMWAKMPANQLAKCAEAGALQRAFPEQLGGLIFEDAAQQPAVIDSTGAPARTRPEPARGVAALTAKVAPTAPSEPAGEEVSPASDPARKKALSAMGRLLKKAEVTAAEDALIVTRALVARDPAGAPINTSADLTNAELAALVGELEALDKDGTLPGRVNDILNQHAINQDAAANQ